MERVGDLAAGAGGALAFLGDDMGAGLAALLDEWAHAVIVCTPQGRLQHANRVAKAELLRQQVLCARAGMVRAVEPDTSVTLQEAMLRAGGGKRCLLTFKTAQGQRLSVAVLPLRAARAGATPLVALVFARATVCDSLMLCFFARSHGLTPTEEQVLGILCQGYSAPEVAQQLQVAVSTIRSHVRNLCAKTGTNGVRELVSRVAVLPPVAPIWQDQMH